MSTIRATYVQHGSSPVPNITLDGSGNVTVASGLTFNSSLSIPSGSVGTPGLSFASDTDTGFYSATPNTIAIATSGTAAVTVDASQRVGIGTTNPSGLLHLSSVSPNLILQGSAYPSVKFRNSAGTDIGEIYYGVSGLDLNIANYSAGPIGFIANGSERARIDSSGRLLVGTSSARSNFYNTNYSSLFQIEGASSDQVAASRFASQVFGNAGDAGPVWVFAKHRSNSLGGNTIVQANDPLGAINFQGADGSELVQAAEIRAEVDGTPGTNDMPGRLVFSTTADGASSPTERMRIDNTGRTIFSSNTGAQSFPNATAFVNDGGFGQALYFANTYGGGKGYVNFRFNSTEIGSISATGTPGGVTTGVAYNTSSDYRLKENVTPVTDGITRLQQLKPSRFNFIADPDTTVDGFLAHEVQSVVPEAITGEKDAVDADGAPAYQGIDQSKLVPLLTAALQEAIGEIESLKARVAALESA